MSEKPVALFADQVRQGMRLEHPDAHYDKFAGEFVVTQVRHKEDLVVILGVRDDGSPYHYHCGSHMVWLCHDAGEVTTS